jgi:hypothetical protein
MCMYVYMYVWVYIVTNSQVLFHSVTLLHSKSQYTTVKHSRQLLEHTYTSDLHGLETPNSYRILPAGPVVAIFQHSLPFLQSESFQTHVGTIHRRAIGPLAHHNGTSACSPSLTFHLPAPTIGCLHSNDSLTTLSSVSTQLSLDRNSSMETPVSLLPFCFNCYEEAFVFIVALTREYNNDAPFNCCVTGESWYVTIWLQIVVRIFLLHIADFLRWKKSFHNCAYIFFQFKSLYSTDKLL